MNEAQVMEIFNKAGGFMEKLVGPSATLRNEYQPKAIAKLMDAAYGKHNAKIHCGCGGGKSLMFAASLAYMFVTKQITRAVIVAPTIALTLQLQQDVQKSVDAWCKVLNVPEYELETVNVSSLENKKKEDNVDDSPEDDEDLLDEDDAVSAKVKRFKEAENKKFQNTCFKIATSEREIKKLLNSKEQKCFFVCKPSFLNKFIPIVKQLKVMIDVTVLDEYHNYVSQNKNENVKSRLYEYDDYSWSTWHFSATRRSGELMSYKDEIFGEEIINVRSGELVTWGYLCPKLNIYLLEPKEVRGIPDIMRQYFEEQGLSDKQVARYFKELGCILNSLKHAVNNGHTPKVVVFSHSVKFIKLLKKSTAFKQLLNDLFGDKIIFEQIDGGTPGVDRDKIFSDIRNAADDVPVLLLNHSVIKEGTDIRGLNTAVIGRGMSQDSLQQALGRIQRAAPGKEFCSLYLYVPDDDDAAMSKHMMTLAYFIHNVIGDLPVSTMALVEDAVGTREGKELEFEAMDTLVINPEVAITAVDNTFIAQELTKFRSELQDEDDKAALTFEKCLELLEQCF